jgi:hypothetical protein
MMDGGELHPMLHDMLYSDDSLNFLDFFDAVADWLSLEYPLEAAGMGAVEPRMLRLALEYRTLPQALVGITYQFHLLYDTVMSGSISDEEVFKLGQYLAEQWESIADYTFGGSK